MESDNKFGARIFEMRQKCHLTQRQLGELVGLSHKAISTIESGRTLTTIDKLILLANYFKVSTDYLLGLTDNPNRAE